MLIHGITITTLVEILTQQEINTPQAWYADDNGIEGKAHKLAGLLCLLMKIGKYFGYIPEPTKSYFICTQKDEAAAKSIFKELGLDIKYTRGHSYVGTFIGSNVMRDRWLQPKIDHWVKAVNVLASFAKHYPQSAYTGFTISLQAQWLHLCRTTPYIAEKLQPVEVAIRQNCCLLFLNLI